MRWLPLYKSSAAIREERAKPLGALEPQIEDVRRQTAMRASCFRLGVFVFILRPAIASTEPENYHLKKEPQV